MKARMQPNFPEGERAILACCLLNGAILPDCLSIVKPEDFWQERNREVYKALVALNKAGTTPDWLSLSAALKSAGKLEAVGGAHFLAELADALPSASNWRHYAEFVIKYSRIRSYISSLSSIVEDCYKPEADPGIIQEQIQDIAYKATRSTETKKPVDVCETIPGYVKSRENRSQHLISSGIQTIDHVTGGFHRGGLYAISGRPSMGKTSLALTSIRHMALQRVVFFASLEMSRNQLQAWLISGESGIDGTKILHGELQGYEQEVAERAEAKVARMALYIDDSPSQKVGQIRSAAKQVAVEAGQIDVIVVDHLQLCRPDNPRDPQFVYLGQISADLKALAKELGAVVIVLVQLNRKIEERPIRNGGRIPRAYDLRGSGDIEQTIDCHMGLYRPERYMDEMTPSEKADLNPINQALVNIDKNRLGRTGRALLLWNGPTTTYSAHVPISQQYQMERI